MKQVINALVCAASRPSARRYAVRLLVGLLFVIGCQADRDTGEELGEHGVGGTGGLSASEGGAGGTGGTGGTGGGVCGAVDGSPSIDRQVSWTESPLRALDDFPASVRMASDCLSFPILEWNACGSDCEFVQFNSDLGEPAYPALSVVVTTDGPRVLLAVSLETPKRVVRRVIDVQTGKTVTALRLDAKRADEPLDGDIGFIPESAVAAPIAVGDLVTYALYDLRTDTWEWKLPPAAFSAHESSCSRLDFDSVPPAMIFGCGAIEGMLDPGSSAVSTITSSGAFGSADANGGLLAWTELPSGTNLSRVKIWDPSAGSREVISALEGRACGIAVGAERLAGFVSSPSDGSRDCRTALTEPRAWYLPRGGRSVVEGPSLGGNPLFVLRAVTSRSFLAAVVARVPNADLPPWEQFEAVLVDMTDRSVRHFAPREGYGFHIPLVALDERYLYVGEARTSAQDVQEIDRLYRYTLPR